MFLFMVCQYIFWSHRLAVSHEFNQNITKKNIYSKSDLEYLVNPHTKENQQYLSRLTKY